MSPPSAARPSDWGRASPRRRATAIGLTLAAELLFLLVLLGLNPELPRKLLSPPMVTIDVRPVSPAATKRSPQPKARAKSEIHQPNPARVTPPPKAPPLPPSPFVAMSKSDMAAADISNLGSHAPGASSADSSIAGPGEGPGGAHLYRAEWYREPTNAELSYYLPKSGVDQGSWADIACQTVTHFHVENCEPLGESPMGSGLARAMRQAAWQFLVRPPRLDGKPLVGSWVRIHIEFTERGEN